MKTKAQVKTPKKDEKKTKTKVAVKTKPSPPAILKPAPVAEITKPLVESTQTNRIKDFLTKNGLGTSCNEMLKRFALETKEDATYAAFRRVYVMFNNGKNILQEERGSAVVDPRYKTIEKRDRSDIAYLVWENIPANEVPGIGNIGQPVLICDPFLQNCEYRLFSVHFKGEKGWKDADGYTVVEGSTLYKRAFLLDSVRLHPSVVK